MPDIIIEHESLPNGKLRYKHLVGRQFLMGKNDCYSILRHIYKDNLGIELTNYARANDWWLTDDVSMYLDNYEREGFQLLPDVKLDQIRPLDVFLIAIPDPRRMEKVVTNHCAIYLNDGIVLHHRMGTLSSLDQWRGALRNFTTHVIRHKDVPDLRQTAHGKLDLMDYILPHKRDLIMGAINEQANDRRD